MARFPSLSAAGDAVPASIFMRLREHLAKFDGDVIPLQIGDTHLAPPQRLDEIDWRELAAGDVYAYGAPNGWTPLVEALARRRGCAATEIQLACGATHALACAVQALCDPGDEIILLSPHWPLIKGIAIGRGVIPVEVPYGDVDAIARAITDKTAAIYFATPNNPDGAMLDRAALGALARLADARGLWLLADEVYEHYVYDGEHVAIAGLARERTVTVGSFAKSYAQAGLRVGYAIAPERVTAAIKKLVNHSVYNVPVAMQRAALGALRGGDGFLVAARVRYRGARDRARAALVAPAAAPPGGAYLWVDLREWAGDGHDGIEVLAKIAEAGVLLAPGSAFGDAYGGFARLCFTGVDEDRLDEGIARINRVLRA